MPKWTKEQELAINYTGSNIIVSAGAGSGKTAVLSERVLKHIKNGMDIDQMLILTFTNAAALEMKERIRKKIIKFGDKKQADKALVADITTFDAYALSLVKKYNYLLNISDNVNIIDSTLLLIKKKQFLNEIFNDYYERGNALFLKLINDFCVKDDKEIFDSILRLNDSLNNLYDKKDYLNNYLENYYGNLDKYINEYFDLIKDKINALKMRIDYLSSYVDYSYIEKINKELFLLFSSNNYDDIRNFLPDKIPNLPRGSGLEAKAIKGDISDIIKEIRKLTSLSEEEMRNSILSTYDYVSIIIEIILKLSDKIMSFKMENNSYEFIDIFKMAISILEDNDDIRDKLKKQYKEILVDEYQDTNDLQELFISLIDNNNVYMVGDIKQSIYRFRNANPLIFKNKYDLYNDLNGGIKIDLNKNFRSRGEVSFAVNKIFSLIMDDKIGGADYINSHLMVYGNKMYDDVKGENYNLEVLSYSDKSDYSKEEIEIFTIGRDIISKINDGFKIMDKETNKEREVNYSDFAILIDRSRDFNLYKRIFEYLNIPLTIYRDRLISDSTDIMIIRNLYRIIVSIYDKNYDKLFKYAFMSVLRSYLYNLDDNEIFNIITLDKYENTVLYKKCLELSLKLDVLDNYSFYLEVINSFDFYDKYIIDGNTYDHIVTSNSILKVVSNLNDLGYNPRCFLGYLDEVISNGLDVKLSLNKDDSNAVKIMTIHGSKGLEFGICYYGGLYRKFNIDELKNKFYFSLDYGFVLPYFENGLHNTIIKFLLKRKYIHEEISERLRLFYVALTRAREKIIMVTPSMDCLSFKSGGIVDDIIREKYNCFSDIIASIYNDIGDYVREIDLDSLDITKDYNYSKKDIFKSDGSIKLEVCEYSFDDSLLKTAKFSKEGHVLIDKKTRENIDFGLRMHSIFEKLDFSNPDYSGLSNYERQLVLKFLDLDIIKDGIEFYKEYEFIYTDDEEKHGIIDLLVKGDDGFSIIDYKLNDITDEAYLKQLNGYKDYICTITGESVDTYLYSIIQGKLVKL